MNKRRFTPWVVLVCMSALAACTSGEGGTANNTELNVLVPNNESSPGVPAPIDIGTVEYTINCLGNSDTFLDNNDSFPDEVILNGNLEVTDGQTSPQGPIPPEFGTPRPGDGAEIWQAFMDLPPGPCTIQLRARDNDGEVICTATEAFSITADTTSKVNLVLICDVSFQAPVGMLDVDATFSFVVGNFCPDLFVLNCVESNPQVPLPGIPPTTYCETRARDGDSTCGQSCDPQTCNPVPEGLVCTPGPDPGVSTTVTCDQLLDCEGDLIPDASCVFPGDVVGALGAGIPVPVLLGGAGPLPGGFFAGCAVDGAGNPLTPGLTISCTAVTTDGDVDCDKTKIVGFTCPGLDPCSVPPFPGACVDSNDCTADVCDASGGSAVCSNPNLPAGTGCVAAGGGLCDGAGNCIPQGCTQDSDCELDGNVCTVPPPGACNTTTGACSAEVPGNDGGSCNSGTGSGDGSCSGGVCVSNDVCTSAPPDCVDSNDCTQDVCSGVPLVCSNPPEPSGTSCDAGGGPGSGACDGAGNCAAPPVVDNCNGVSSWRALPKVCDVGVFDATAFSFTCTTFRSPPVDIPGGGTANAFCSGTPSGCPAAGCEVPSSTLAGQLAVDVFIDFDVTSVADGNVTHNYTVNAVNAALGIAAAIANLVDITVFSDVTSGVPAQLINVLDPAFANTTLGLYVVGGTTLVLDNEIPAVTTAVVPTSSPNVAFNFSGNFLLELFLTTAMAPLNVDSSACTFDIVGSDVICGVL